MRLTLLIPEKPMPLERFVVEGRDHEPAQDIGAGLTWRRVLVLLSVLACALFAVVFGGEEAHACKYAQSM